MDKKIIHYCWFGGNELDKLALKCIESWKKYLPEYEIMQWNEQNFNINEYKFTKYMYENKKWAYVADYVRTKALLEYGGIYFDTDMEIVADVSKFLNEKFVLCAEDSKYVNLAMCIVNEKNNHFFKELLGIYNNMDLSKIDKINKISIPILTTDILEKHGYIKENYEEIQIIDEGNIKVYPREYFYPYSYDYQDNKFTENTCMIHHFNASWTSNGSKLRNFLRKNNLNFIAKILDTIYEPVRYVLKKVKESKNK